MVKKVLIVSRSFYPIQSPRSFRTTELVKEFSRQGHQVTVITHKQENLHNEFEKKYNVIIKDLGKLFWKPSINKNRNLFSKVINLVLNKLIEFPDIQLLWMVNKTLKAEDNYDLLISIAVPHAIHWGVAKARSQNHPIAITWVADCGDPFMGNKFNRRFFYFKYIEKWFCRKADYLSVPIQTAVKAYYKEFHSKIRIIPQGFKFEELSITSAITKNPISTFAYAGTFYRKKRDPTAFLKYLCTLNRDFKFIIYTTDCTLITPFKGILKNKLEIRNVIPRHDLFNVLNTMDFLVNFENENNVQSPSKLIDYLILNKPVLNIRNGTFDNKIINEFLNANYENHLILPDKKEYEIEMICKKFLALTDK